MGKQSDILESRAIPAEIEEIGVDFIYRCGYLNCHKTIHRYFNYCPYCGTKVDWSDSDAKKLQRRFKRRN